MQYIHTIIAVGLLLCCGCQGTGPAKIDNPVVGPPPPRLPPEKIRERQLAYAGQSDDLDGATVGNPDRVARKSKEAQLEERLSPTGIQRVSLTESADADLPAFDDGMVVAMVNEQPIFAGEVLAPMRAGLKKAEAEMKKEYGKKFKPEMVYRLRAMFISNALPRLVETKMLILAAKSEFKKNQLEGLNKAIDKEWGTHLEQMMEKNKCKSVSELEALLEKNDYDLEEHEAAFRDSQLVMNYVSFKAHSKFEPTRKEMLNYYEEHLEEYEFPSRVHWQQLVINDQAHKGPEGAKQHLDIVVKELLEGADFTATVKKYGDGPKAANGGMWEWTIKGSLQNKELENELFTLPIGEMSGVIRVPTGYQIVQVLDRQEAGRQPFETQQKAIEAKLKEDAYKTRATEMIHEIRDATVIKTVFDAQDPKEKVIEQTSAKATVGASEKPDQRSLSKPRSRESKPARASVKDDGEMHDIAD